VSWEPGQLDEVETVTITLQGIGTRGKEVDIEYPASMDWSLVQQDLGTRWDNLKTTAGDMWDSMNTLDQLAIITAPVPGLGDIVGVAADARMFIQEPESRTWINGALAGAGVVPLIPAASVAGNVADLGRKVLGKPVQRPVIDAWHGTPHQFPAERLVRNASDGTTRYIEGTVGQLPDVPDGFDLVEDFPQGRMRMDKLGTGEGAQAYGHGLYNADAEEVGRMYQENLSVGTGKQRALNYLGERGIPNKNYEANLFADILIKNDGDIGGALKEFDSYARGFEGGDKTTLSDFSRAVRERLGDSGKYDVTPNQGNLYRTQIDVDPDTLLDWDKPLSEQSEYVKNSLRNRMDGPDNYLTDQGSISNPSGKQIYEGFGFDTDVFSGKNSEVASNELREAGIPGIRYLDGDSRSIGGGTSNYVIFDDSLISIADDLDMSQQARMARAEGMGFDKDVYHATQQDITEMVPGYDDGLVFTTPNPDMANDWLGKGRYRGRIGAEDEIESIRKAQSNQRREFYDFGRLDEIEKRVGTQSEEWVKAYDEMAEAAKVARDKDVPADSLYGAIYPLKTSVKNTFDPRTGFNEVVDLLEPDVISSGIHKEGNWIVYEKPEIVERLRSLGYDSMLLKESAAKGAAHETLAIFDPKNIRSVNAAFDPAKKDSSNLLAEVLGGAVLTGAVASERDKRKNEL